MTAPNAAPLPSPGDGRFQPLRSGLLNLYRFDAEELWFERGRLLLRGHNGTGKSRVLALQLPFLLDGEVSPHRMEPDGDPAKRAEWNLLMGKHPERTGYTWIELGRRDEDGTEHFVTLGCGMSAVAGRGKLDKWFFVTPQRIGRDVYLQSDLGHPLSRRRLEEVVEGHGRVYTTAAEYRRAVDDALFHLGEQRYEALVDLLIQLRQPQLSRKLDEDKLSSALSEALPPLAPNVLDDVAESFRSLEADRDALDHLTAAARGVETFLERYRQYAAVAARRRAEDVRTTHSAYETTQRKLREAEQELAHAKQLLEEASAQTERLGREEHAAAARVETLRESPEMRQADALEAARRRAEERRREAERAARELDEAQDARARRQEELEAARGALGQAVHTVEERLAASRDHARPVGLETVHDRALDALAPPAVAEPDAVASARDRLESEAERRREGARVLDRLQARARDAEHALTTAKERWADKQAELDDALDRQRQAHESAERAFREAVDAYRAWAEDLAELAPAQADEVAEALDDWRRNAEGPSPLTLAARDALDRALSELSAETAALAPRIEAEEIRRKELDDERKKLLAGVHHPPPPPHTRDVALRAERPGAPFWRLVDFRSEVPEDHRRGLEAALEASGLLDAWVTPEGRVLDAKDHDTALAVLDDFDTLTWEGSTLSEALRPEPPASESPVAEPVVTRLLSQIGLVEDPEAEPIDDSGPVWIAVDGRFRLGPLTGSWSKPVVQHVGETAREAERRRRLDAVEAEIAAVEEMLTDLEAARDDLERRQTKARREAASAPEDNEIRRAHTRVESADREVRERREIVAEAETAVTHARRRRDDAVWDRDETAEDLGLREWLNDLPGLVDAVASYRESLAGLWPGLEAHRTASRHAREARDRTERAEADATRRNELLQEARNKAEAARAEHATLEETMGAAVEEILNRLESAKQELEELRRRREEAREAQSALKVRIGVAENDIERTTELLERDAVTRRNAVDAFGRFVATGLLSLLEGFSVEDSEEGPASWSVTRTVDLARRLESHLSGVEHDDAAWDRLQRGIHRHVEDLFDALRAHDYAPERTLQDELLIVTVPFQGRMRHLAELAGILTAEIDERRRVLSAREREVIENHLIGEVAAHLHERIRDAEDWLQRVNRQLADRPMSTGMALRFAWNPADDGPAGLAEARKRLLTAGALWSPEEREALGRFLQRRIETVRESDETGTWQEHLRRALDYRAWHRFSVERRQDGQWRRLTRRTHGTGSGGEKAVALTVPQFAAAAAHYDSADSRAPRLILLDEAFVGVDPDMRAKCMGLLAAFDLDFVMTSEREWGCYSTMPGLAIYQLAAHPHIDAVHLTRWVWNGHERVRDGRDLVSSASPTAETPEEAREAVLFSSEE